MRTGLLTAIADGIDVYEQAACARIDGALVQPTRPALPAARQPLPDDHPGAWE